jgi:hypothetical protein
MGASSLAGMLEVGSVDQALSWHLSSNHYPPIPSSVIPIAKRAIRLAQQGKWDSLVDLKGTCTFQGKSKAPVSECVRAWHLDQFLEQEG